MLPLQLALTAVCLLARAVARRPDRARPGARPGPPQRPRRRRDRAGRPSRPRHRARHRRRTRPVSRCGSTSATWSASSCSSRPVWCGRRGSAAAAAPPYCSSRCCSCRSCSFASPTSGPPVADRAPAGTGRGFGRVLVFVYGVFALAATGRSALQLATKASEAPVPYGLSAFAAVDLHRRHSGARHQPPPSGARRRRHRDGRSPRRGPHQLPSNHRTSRTRRCGRASARGTATSRSCCPSSVCGGSCAAAGPDYCADPWVRTGKRQGDLSRVCCL